MNHADMWCSTCIFKSRIDQMLEDDEDDQDWEFAICEECGSWLDSGGVCRNQNCGNSPDLGKDWY